MGKNALVVSGGAAKGAFAVGALQHLLDRGIDFHFVSGTSTGALVAPLLVTDEVDALEKIYTSVTDSDILRHRKGNVFKTTSLMSAAPLQSILQTGLEGVDPGITEGRWGTIRDSAVQMVIVAVCLQTGKTTYFFTGTGNLRHTTDTDARRIESRQMLIDAIYASACSPVLMPAVKIRDESGKAIRTTGTDKHGNPKAVDNMYVDGGAREYAPLQVAIDNNADDVYAIILSPETRTPKLNDYTSLLNVGKRALSLQGDEVGADDLTTATLYSETLSHLADLDAYLTEVRDRARVRHGLSEAEIDALLDGRPSVPPRFVGRRAVRIHAIRPARGLLEFSHSFDPERMREMAKEGREAARRVVG